MYCYKPSFFTHFAIFLVLVRILYVNKSAYTPEMLSSLVLHSSHTEFDISFWILEHGNSMDSITPFVICFRSTHFTRRHPGNKESSTYRVHSMPPPLSFHAISFNSGISMNDWVQISRPTVQMFSILCSLFLFKRHWFQYHSDQRVLIFFFDISLRHHNLITEKGNKNSSNWESNTKKSQRISNIGNWNWVTKLQKRNQAALKNKRSS